MHSCKTDTHVYVHIHTQFGIRSVPHHLSLVISAPPPYLSLFLMYTDLHSSRHKHTHSHTHTCTLTLMQKQQPWEQWGVTKPFICMYIMYTGRDAETKRANMLTRMHTHKHTVTHTCTHAHKKPSTLRHALWSSSVDQNSFLSAFPSKSIPPLVDRQP